MMKSITLKRYMSPIGDMILGSVDEGLCMCDWAVEKRRATVDSRIRRHLGAEFVYGDSGIIDMAIVQLEEYFAGERREFTVPTVFAGTDFQRRVWSELKKIRYGETVSYARLAHLIGEDKAVRAVALASASNAISIFVPCHRVIGSNGRLTGYAGGIDAKRMLLDLEMSTLTTFRV